MSGVKITALDKTESLLSVSMALTMMTGVGVFVYPNMVLREVQSGGGALVLWGAAGLLSLLAALTYSELALAIPVS